ncbi:MAG: hypothetical protein V3U04_01440 [Candidatus Aerophobetes bacterium]
MALSWRAHLDVAPTRGETSFAGAPHVPGNVVSTSLVEAITCLCACGKTALSVLCQNYRQRRETSDTKTGIERLKTLEFCHIVTNGDQ